MQEQLEEVLLPEQSDRLREIAIQVLNVMALRDEEITSELKITDDQKKEMDELQKEFGEKMQELFPRS